MRNIKNLCRDKGITLAELANSISIHPQSLSRIISTDNTTEETKLKIAGALGVIIADLYLKDDNNERFVIRPLSDQSKWSIAKIIHIIGPTAYGEQHLGDIFYRRTLNPSYKLIEDNDRNPWDDYPKQKNYPNDILDTLILNAIKFNYPQTHVTNKLIVFNTNIDHLNTLANRLSVPIEIHATPNIDFSQAQHYVDQKKEFVQFRFNFNMYLNFLNEEFIIKLFSSSYDLEKEKKIDNLYSTFTPN